MKVSSITVAMATYNRASTLKETLAHLSKCVRPNGVKLQVVLVNNNSTDNTSDVIADFAGHHHNEVEVVWEPNQGAGHARNAGLRHATGELIATIDDDIIPDINFLVQVRDEFERLNCRGVIGGRIELWNPKDLPFALQRGDVEKKLTVLDHPGGFIAGGNLALHRDVLERVGGFDQRLGPGTPLYAADDTDFFYRALKAGCEVRYSPNIVAFHNHGRSTEQQIIKLFRGYFISNGAFFMKHILRGDRDMLRMLYWEMLSFLPRNRPKDLSPLHRRLRRGKLRYYLLGAIRYLRVARLPEN